ncbi:MAG: 3-deoxy-manno-octulosonate cytidylyltransferase [Deltaproteobacteria bacterium]|nr:3-deoxy-manno-octulosonate cytidylyltransferase [Deltaproteobacteria bacterium]
MKKIIAVIPARYKSTRFEGKPLALIMGKPMIRHVYEGVIKSEILSDVIIATEDRRIYDVCRAFGANAVMTKDTHQTGTDRIIEAVSGIDADIVLNVQGDEPLVNSEIIEALVMPFNESGDISYTSVKTPIYSYEEFIDPNNVKVIVDKNNFGIYFSRSPIPYDRERASGLKDFKGIFGYKHLGFYGYTKEFLLEFGKTDMSYLEKKEMLEQLRAIENGHKIKVETVNISTIPVDVPDDIKKVENFILKSYND